MESVAIWFALTLTMIFVSILVPATLYGLFDVCRMIGNKADKKISTVVADVAFALVMLTISGCLAAYLIYFGYGAAKDVFFVAGPQPSFEERISKTNRVKIVSSRYWRAFR